MMPTAIRSADGTYQVVPIHASLFNYFTRVRRAPMSVLGVTIFVSTMLALFFVGGFLYHHDFSGGDPMRDSLLPFGKEGTHSTPPSLPVPPSGPSMDPDPENTRSPE